MKILYTIPNNKNRFHTMLGWVNYLSNKNNVCVPWNKNERPTFDVFDEIEPDLFLMFINDFNLSIYKCLQERPYIRTIFFCYNWISTNENSKNLLLQAYKEIQCPEILCMMSEDIVLDNQIEHPPLLDTILFNKPQKLQELETDLLIIEPPPEYIKYFINVRNLNLKVLSSTKLEIPQWIGSCEYSQLQFLLNSAKYSICFPKGDIRLQQQASLSKTILPEKLLEINDWSNLDKYTENVKFPSEQTYEHKIREIFSKLDIEC